MKTNDGRRGYGEGGLRLRGNVWYLLYRVNGEQKSESSKVVKNGTVINDGTSKQVALEMLRDRLVDTNRGATPPQDVKQLRYEDIKEAYLRDNREQRYYVEKKSHLDDFFAGKKVVDIDTNLIRDFIDHRREEDEVSDPTIRRNLIPLRAMLRLAHREGKLGLQGVPYFPMPEDSDPAGQYIEPEQFQKILNALETERQRKAKLDSNDDHDLRPFFAWMYATGCRLGATKKITWGMVDKKKSLWLVDIPGTFTKNGSPLKLSLAGEFLKTYVTDMLNSKKVVTLPRNSDPVFDFTNYRAEWNKATAAAGLATFDKKNRRRGEGNIRIHDCRCSGAINLIDAAVDRDMVLAIGGWKTDAMLRRYNRPTEARLHAAMEKGGEYVTVRMNGTK